MQGRPPPIATLTRAAFGGSYEAVLIDRLRHEGLVILSLVAERQGQIRGHILFSRLNVNVDGKLLAAAALAPMSVCPEHQNQGIGSALVREGAGLLRARGFDAVLVLGHPAYYPRFGFSAETAQFLVSPYAGESFMALELRPGALRGKDGRVVYPAAFDGD